MVDEKIQAWVKKYITEYVQQWTAGILSTKVFPRSSHQMESRGTSSKGLPIVATREGYLDNTFLNIGELVADTVGAMTTGNTESGITVAYQDSDNTIDFTVAADTTNIVNDAVTNAKLANMAQSTIKGREAGAGTGDPTDLTATQVRTLINVENGADATDASDVLAHILTLTSGSAPGSTDTALFVNAGNTGYYRGAVVDQASAQTIAGNKTFSDDVIHSGKVRYSRESLTIASGAVTPTQSFIMLTGEGSVADDLDTIGGTTTGDIFYVRCLGTHTITVKDGTGNIALAGGDFALDHSTDLLTLLCNVSGSLVELARSNNT